MNKSLLIFLQYLSEFHHCPTHKHMILRAVGVFRSTKRGVLKNGYARASSTKYPRDHFLRLGILRELKKGFPKLKKLGVTILWIMPIHPVGVLNRKGPLGSQYSVQDYYAINPEFGTLDDFRRLVNSAHKLGFHLIIDLVANHTAWDSKLIKEHPDWFTKDSAGNIVPPNPD